MIRLPLFYNQPLTKAFKFCIMFKERVIPTRVRDEERQPDMSTNIRDTAELLSVFTHDFKNRVNSITLALWLLERKDPAHHEAIAAIKAQMRDLTLLVEDVRTRKGA